MPVTKVADLAAIIPAEVVSDSIRDAIIKPSGLLQFAERDNTLVNAPGETIVMGSWNALANVMPKVAEDQPLPFATLSAKNITATVEEFGLTVPVSRRAVLAAGPNNSPMNQAVTQLRKIARRTLNQELVADLATAPHTVALAGAGLTWGAFVDGFTNTFGESFEPGEFVFAVDALTYASILKDPSFINAQAMTNPVMLKGFVGTYGGVNVVRADGLGGGVLMRPDSLKVIYKDEFFVNYDYEGNSRIYTVDVTMEAATALVAPDEVLRFTA